MSSPTSTAGFVPLAANNVCSRPSSAISRSPPTRRDHPDYRIAARRPLVWGISSGVIMAAVGQLLFGEWILSVVVGAVFGAANWFLWRRNGPAHRWRSALLRRFPPRSE